jgi:hypothetical protein
MYEIQTIGKYQLANGSICRKKLICTKTIEIMPMIPYHFMALERFLSF